MAEIIANVNSVGCQVPPYSETHSLRTGSEARLRVEVRWNLADGYPSTVLGDVGIGGAGAMSRTNPLRHPKKSWLRCMECNLVGHIGAPTEDDRGLIAFFDNKPGAVLVAGEADRPSPDGKAIFELIFRRPPFDFGNDGIIEVEYDRWTIKRTKRSLQNMTLPANQFKWRTDGVIVPEAVTRLRPYREVEYTWLMVPEEIIQELEQNEWDSIEGRINSDIFDGYPDGSLLCLPPEKGDLYSSPSGLDVRDIKYRFAFRADVTSWNYFWRKGSGFKEIVRVDDPTKGPYEFTAFKPLFLG